VIRLVWPHFPVGKETVSQCRDVELSAPRGFGGLLVPRSRQAREGRVETSPQQQCSGQPEQIVGDRSLCLGCYAGPGGSDPERHSSGYAHVVQRATPSTPAQVAADSATFVVTPCRAPTHARGPSHEGPEG